MADVTASELPPAEAPLPDSPMEELRREIADASIEEAEQRRAHPEDREDFRPAPPGAISDAIEEVNTIMTSLRQVLDQMEEVLEILELAEVQKNVDEREIENLRRALRQSGREPREPREHSHQRQGRYSGRR